MKRRSLAAYAACGVGDLVSQRIPNDNLTHAGAVRLASRIGAFWQAKKRTVLVRVECVKLNAYSTSIGSNDYYVVRSDMVGGLPRPKVVAR